MKAIKLLLLSIVLSSTLLSVPALSQSMYLDHQDSGILIGGGMTIHDDIYTFEGGVVFSPFSLFDISISFGNADYSKGDEGDGDYYSLGFMLHPFRAESNSTYSLAPVYSYTKVNYKSSSLTETDLLLGGMLLVRHNLRSSRFLVFESGLFHTEAALDDGDDSLGKHDAIMFMVGIDICQKLKSGNVFVINPSLSFNDDVTVFGFSLGYMFTGINLSRD